MVIDSAVVPFLVPLLSHPDVKVQVRRYRYIECCLLVCNLVWMLFMVAIVIKQTFT